MTAVGNGWTRTVVNTTTPCVGGPKVRGKGGNIKGKTKGNNRQQRQRKVCRYWSLVMTIPIQH